nr:hypothetical protein [Tanacetum cinerariifolium]
MYSLEVLAIEGDETQDSDMECLGEENLDDIPVVPWISLNAINKVKVRKVMRGYSIGVEALVDITQVIKVLVLYVQYGVSKVWILHIEGWIRRIYFIDMAYSYLSF